MAEYIEREDLVKHLDILYNRLCGKSPHFYCGFMTVVDYVKEFSDADVKPVVHGRKIEDGDIGCFWLCSLCGECLPYGANYCPNCGAKMDGGDGNEA